MADKKLELPKTDEKMQSLINKFLKNLLSGNKDQDLSLVSVEDDDEGRKYFIVEGDESVFDKLEEPVPRPTKEDEKTDLEDQEETSKQRKNDRDQIHYDL
jgi:hypothetical protein